ncbi:uncharacterized protein BXZ73DRAFT_104853 [Epithele typhae]|uniref:uncharacterized protein n=1 Tax=Epithele typhae TaxID=378194 RepID=UPI002007AC9B|nr:uncharacterized protein BXZ73DRAFT_104853 [Epithele typhae]KAH9919749.1 hypothetical protein BXZ73DRAFT_104853 [Epithele typhae]
MVSVKLLPLNDDILRIKCSFLARQAALAARQRMHTQLPVFHLSTLSFIMALPAVRDLSIHLACNKEVTHIVPLCPNRFHHAAARAGGALHNRRLRRLTLREFTCGSKTVPRRIDQLVLSISKYGVAWQMPAALKFGRKFKDRFTRPLFAALPSPPSLYLLIDFKTRHSQYRVSKAPEGRPTSRASPKRIASPSSSFYPLCLHGRFLLPASSLFRRCKPVITHHNTIGGRAGRTDAQLFPNYHDDILGCNEYG